MYSMFSDNNSPKDRLGIQLIQSFLRHGGYTGLDGLKLQTDGIFGANTDYAVRHFQRNNGLAVDGIVGPMTRAMLGGNFARPTPIPVNPHQATTMAQMGLSSEFWDRFPRLRDAIGANRRGDIRATRAFFERM